MTATSSDKSCVIAQLDIHTRKLPWQRLYVGGKMKASSSDLELAHVYPLLTSETFHS